MKISCPSCRAAFQLDDGRVPAAGLSIKCPKCKSPFSVRRPRPGEEGKIVEGRPTAVPLPGLAAPPPAVAARTDGAAPADSLAVPDAVPLPGFVDAGLDFSFPPPEGLPPQQPGAVPLPGHDGARLAPTRARAVPLPGGDGAQVVPTLDEAVPLPGDGFATGASPRFDPTAIPLPGHDDGGAPAASTVQSQAARDPFGLDDLADDTVLDARPPLLSRTAQLAMPPPPPPPSMPPPSADADPFALVDTAFDEPPARSARQPAILPDDGGLNFDFVEAPTQSALRPASATSVPLPGSRELLDFVEDRPAAAPPPSTTAGAGAERAAAKKRAPPVMGNLPPPPMLSRSVAQEEPEPLLPPEPGARPAKKKSAGKPPGELLRARLGPAFELFQATAKRPARVAVALLGTALIVLIVLGVRAASTPAGPFWRNRLFAPSATSAATAKVLAVGRERLAEGSFAGAREALGAAASLLSSAPADEEAKAFFLLCASELRFSYGQVGADWDRAPRVLSSMKGTGPAQQRARGAYALASGDVASARSLLSALGEQHDADVESVWLYAQTLVRAGEAPHAAQVLDNALVTHALGKLLLARGLVEVKRGKLADAASWFEKVLAGAPDNGRALIELADVKLASGDVIAAAALIDRALAPEVRKTLDATEEARANMLRGRLLAQQHDSKGAELAFETAVTLDPSSVAIRAAYGSFRLRHRDYDKAAKQFDVALAAGEVPADVLGEAALAFIGVNRWVDADKRANEAVAKEGNSAHLIYVQGKVAEVLGKADEAGKLYDKALAKQPDLAEALIAKGLLAIGQGDKVLAQANLDLAMKTPEAGKSAADHEGIGDLWLSLGGTEAAAKAKDAFAVALRLDPEDPQAHAGLGRALAALNDFKGARAELEDALRRTDTDASMYYQYGSLLRTIGESDNALAALQKAVALDGKDARYHARLGALLVDRGEFDKAEEQLKNATLSNDKLGDGWFFLARALAGEKKLAEAVDTMKRAVELEPDNAQYLYYLGLIYEQGQQVQDAIDSLTKSIAHDAKNPDAFEHLGQDFTVENRYTEAVSAFRKAAQLDPGRARLLALLGDSMQQAGDVDGAIENFTRAVRQNPKLPGVWSKLGVAFRDKGCTGCKTRAIDALTKATEVDPKDTVAWHELGYLYKDDSKRAESIAAFRKYLEFKPDAVDAETVKDEIYYLQEESQRAP